jgi:two-component system, NarL family, response regulator YdfI
VTRILIGATSEVVRVELASLLATDPTAQVIGSLSVKDALAQFEDLQPDIVLLDLESPAEESVPVAVEVAEVVSPVLVVLTDNPEKLLPVDAVRSGVRAILPRVAKAEEIFAAIQATMAGLVVLHPDAIGSVMALADSGEPPGLEVSDQILTPREIEVLRMIAEGLANKEIASKLGISDHTAKFHTSSIFAKLGASNRAEAVTLGIRQGLIMV